MTAAEEFSARVNETDAMLELRRSLHEEPIRLLQQICSRFEETGRPVADHSLQLVGYFGDVMLRVLVQTHYIERISERRGPLNAYRPSQDGLDIYHAMLRETDA